MTSDENSKRNLGGAPLAGTVPGRGRRPGKHHDMLDHRGRRAHDGDDVGPGRAQWRLS